MSDSGNECVRPSVNTETCSVALRTTTQSENNTHALDKHHTVRWSESSSNLQESTRYFCYGTVNKINVEGSILDYLQKLKTNAGIKHPRTLTHMQSVKLNTLSKEMLVKTKLKQEETPAESCTHADSWLASTHASDWCMCLGGRGGESPRLPIPAHPLSARSCNREGYNSGVTE